MKNRSPADIYKSIPGMTPHTVNNYVKRGFVRADVRDPNKSGAAKLYSPVEAMRAGLIWYFNKMGYDLERSTAMAYQILSAPGYLAENEENNPTSRNQCLVLVGTFPLTMVPTYNQSRPGIETAYQPFKVTIGSTILYIPMQLLKGIPNTHTLGFILVRPVVEKVAQWLDMDLEMEFSDPTYMLNPGGGERTVVYPDAISQKLNEDFAEMVNSLK